MTVGCGHSLTRQVGSFDRLVHDGQVLLQCSCHVASQDCGLAIGQHGINAVSPGLNAFPYVLSIARWINRSHPLEVPGLVLVEHHIRIWIHGRSAVGNQDWDGSFRIEFEEPIGFTVATIETNLFHFIWCLRRLER